jgi:hypothetical protein
MVDHGAARGVGGAAKQGARSGAQSAIAVGETMVRSHLPLLRRQRCARAGLVRMTRAAPVFCRTRLGKMRAAGARLSLAWWLLVHRLFVVGLYQEALKHEEWTRSVRRLLHQHPELGMAEHKTGEIVRHALDELGVAYRYVVVRCSAALDRYFGDLNTCALVCLPAGARSRVQQPGRLPHAVACSLSAR